MYGQLMVLSYSLFLSQSDTFDVWHCFIKQPIFFLSLFLDVHASNSFATSA